MIRALLAALFLAPAAFAGSFQLPRLTAEMTAHMNALDFRASPQVMASVLASRAGGPTATPSEVAAAKLLVDAIKSPEGLAAVQEYLLPAEDSRLTGRLELLARRVQGEAGGPQAFEAVLAGVGGQSWSTTDAEAVRLSLDAFFTGAYGSGAQVPAVFAAAPGGSSQDSTVPKLKKIDFQVSVGNLPLEQKITLGELMKALDEDDRGFLDRFRSKDAAKPQDRVVRLEDGTGRVRVMAVAGAEKDQRTIWADFSKNERHPLLDKLKEKFTFAPFVSTAGDEQLVSYEEPQIDEDTAQLTLYGVKLSKDGALSSEETRVYVGERLLVTTHATQRASVETALHLLADTGRFKTPSELMVFLLADNISRYGAVGESLSADFAKMSEKLAAKDADASVLADSVAVGRKIDEAYKIVMKQKQVLRALMRINEFHQSPLVPAAQLEKLITSLNHQLDVLDHHQDRKKGIVDLYRAKLDNQQNAAMKHLAAFTALMLPATVVGALYGMNVGLPGAGHPHMFAYLVAGVLVAMGTIFLVLRKLRWL